MPPFWSWLNILSLDAPLVAVLWQALLARTFQIPLRPAGRLALGLTVWAIYLADRVLDARNPPHPGEPLRHRAYRLYPRQALLLSALVFAADLSVSLELLRPQVIRNGLLVFGGVCLYLTALHVVPGRFKVPKEFLVAVLFTVGTFLVAVTNSQAPWQTLWKPAVAFLGVCLANLVQIDYWEWRELRGSRPDAANRATIRLGRWFHVWVPLLAAGCLWAGLSRGSSWYLCIALSLAATLCVARSPRRISLDLRRALVDAVLMTPVLFLLW